MASRGGRQAVSSGLLGRAAYGYMVLRSTYDPVYFNRVMGVALFLATVE